MPKLTSYTRQIRPSAGQNVISASAGSAGVGLQQAGADVTAFANQLKVVSDKRDAVSIEKALIDGGLEMDAFRLELEKNAAPGGAGHTEAMRAEYARWSEGFKENFTNVSPDNQGRLDLGVARQRASVVSASMTFEAASTAKKVREDMEGGLGTVRNQIGDGSVTYEDGLNSGTSLIVAGMSGDPQQAALNDWRNDAADAHFQRLLRAANTPESVMAVKGDLSDLQDQMDADTYASALNKIDASHDVLLRQRDTDISTEVRDHASLRQQGYAGNGVTRDYIDDITDPRKRALALKNYEQGEAIGVFADMVVNRTPEEIEAIEAGLLDALKVEGNDVVEAGQLVALQRERVSRAHAQGELNRRIPDVVASIADGEYDPTVVEEIRNQIDARVLNVDDRARYHKAVDTAVEQGEIRQQVPNMGEAETIQRSAELTAKVDAALDGARDEAVASLTTYSEALRIRNAKLKADPVKYVAENDPLTQRALEYLQSVAGTENEAAARSAYVSTLVAAQERLGVNDPRVLTQSEVDGVSNAVDALGVSDTAAVELRDLLSGYSNTYGENWPSVYRQLIEDKALDGAHVALARIAGDPLKDAASNNLASAIFSRAEYEDSLGTNAAGDVDDAARAVFSEVARTFTAQGDTATGNLYKDAIYTLALHYKAGGKSDADAAKQAYEDLLGGDFSTVTTSTDAYRIPRTDANGGPVSETLVVRGAAAMKQNLSAFSIIPTPGLTTQQKADSLATFGRWVTAPDGSGLMLLTEQGSPVEVFSPVAGQESPRRDPLVVPWDTLVERARTVTGVDAESFPGLGDVDPNASLGSMLRTFAQ